MVTKSNRFGGEQPLPDYGCCDLGPIILPKFVLHPFTDKALFDIELFRKTVAIHVRFLDNVLDVTLWPLDKQKIESGSKRRIGLGFTGLANMLSMMGYAYNTTEGLKFADYVTKTMRDTAYMASVELAKERGSFPLFNAEKYLEDGTAASRLPNEIKEEIRKYGIRNSHLLSIAPVGCVTPDTLIITENGLHEISELGNKTKDQWKDINIQVMTDEGFKTSDKFFNNGIKPVKKITDNYGYNITATDNHQLRIITETGDYVWKRMDQLNIGDILIKCVNTYPNINILPNPDNKTNENHGSITKLKENIVFTKGIAELVGFLMSNGNVKTQRHIRLYHHIDYAEKTFNKIIKTLEEDLGILNSKIYISTRVNNPNLAELNIYSKELVTWLTINDSIKNGASHLRIPKWVLNSNREIVYSFLRGLYEGDGSGGLTSITYTSIDKVFINKLQQVLASIGIVTRKDISGYGDAVGRFGNNDVYRLSIGNRKDKFRYYKDIGFMSNKGSQILINYNEELNYRTYYQSVQKTLTKAFGFIDYKNKVHTKLKELGITEEVMFTEIVNIEDLEPTQTVDISVPYNVTYIANSFVSHNTVSLAFADNASNGIEPPFSLAYTRKKRMSDGSKKEYAVVDHSLNVYLSTLEKNFADRLLDAIVNYKTTFIYGGKEFVVKDVLPKSIVTALDLTPTEHLAMMEVVQPYICSSISKTVNIPADYPFEDFKTVYDQAWKSKLKGVATYRPNSILGSVLSVGTKIEEKPVEAKVEVTKVDEDPYNTFMLKRPNGTLSSKTKKVEYLSSGYIKDDFYVGISFLNDIKRPIEVFFTVCPEGVSQEWLDSYAINLSLLARGGLNLFCKALRADRKVKSDKGQLRYGWYTKTDGEKVPRFHTSEVACMAYAIQEILIEEGIITEQGFPVNSEKPKEVKTESKSNTIVPGKLCNECGAYAVIKKDSCSYCTNCHVTGECG